MTPPFMQIIFARWIDFSHRRIFVEHGMYWRPQEFLEGRKPLKMLVLFWATGSPLVTSLIMDSSSKHEDIQKF
jgi:hypothetical protein